MEQRFRFISPTPRELLLVSWGKPAVALVLVLFIITNPFNSLSVLVKVTIAVTVLIAFLVLFWRIGDINRRDAQAKYGSVEFTEGELRVSLSSRSLMRISWSDFKGAEVKNGWLCLNYYHAQIDMADASARLDRVRLRELEHPDALINALRVQTAPST